MTTTEALELLDRYVASDDKVQVWGRMGPAADPFPLSDGATPIPATEAIVCVGAAAATAADLGFDPVFTVRRWES